LVACVAGVLVGMTIGVPIPGEPLARRARAAEERAAQAEADLATLRAAVPELQKQVESQTQVVKWMEEAATRNGTSLAQILADPAPPEVDTRVVGIIGNPTIVVLPVGSSDGVEKGRHFRIVRDGRDVGKVVVEKVLRDSCGCRVLYTLHRAVIAAGDVATTKRGVHAW
jgi:hypothetical protein